LKVWVDVPDFWHELMDKAAKMEGWDKRTHYLRELIKNDLRRKGLLGTTVVIDDEADCEVISQ